MVNPKGMVILQKTWVNWVLVAIVSGAVCSMLALVLVKTGVVGSSDIGVSVAGRIAKPTAKPAAKPIVKPKYIDVTALQVKRGDTLSAIAERNGLTLSQIAKLNPQIHNLNLIFPNQRIRVG